MGDNRNAHYIYPSINWFRISYWWCLKNWIWNWWPRILTISIMSPVFQRGSNLFFERWGSLLSQFFCKCEEFHFFFFFHFFLSNWNLSNARILFHIENLELTNLAPGPARLPVGSPFTAPKNEILYCFLSWSNSGLCLSRGRVGGVPGPHRQGRDVRQRVFRGLPQGDIQPPRSGQILVTHAC